METYDIAVIPVKDIVNLASVAVVDAQENGIGE
ncbi:hypothetical protein C448_12806 [Halococcus morrhuae DSM 1307]|uniref:Uncharacterized protein n=1 Tax=Halococcus morrhuae DSM 1307 TaxID=931277 RepID=M0M8L4_HALMO|nr:hypothetical protein C448_12806 [Halococcus morrhuae DSM 1307]